MPEVRPEDDYTHQPGDAPNFNESYYFNFYDRHHRIGGFMRLGNRVNEGHAEMTLCVYLPNGHALFDFQRAPIQNNDRFDAGGLTMDMLEPLKRHHTVYRGKPIDMAYPLDLLEPGNAFRNNPRVELEIDLVHEATGPCFEPPPYGPEHAFSLQMTSVPIGERDLADAIRVEQTHNEQHMRVAGHVVLDGTRIPIEGLGMRDHSYGPRTWARTGGHSRWLTVCLREDLGVMIQDLGRADGSRLLTGVVVRDGEMDWMTSIDLQTKWDGFFQRSLAARFTTESGATEVLEGDVLSLVPLRHMGEDSITRVGEGLTEYCMGDVVGYGLSEYFDSYPL